ncbi:protein of unknown function [Shinella sp. WSC3-e]|nr:protein of unknown function [Shinella sp. WSC3-e]
MTICYEFVYLNPEEEEEQDGVSVTNGHP